MSFSSFVEFIIVSLSDDVSSNSRYPVVLLNYDKAVSSPSKKILSCMFPRLYPVISRLLNNYSISQLTLFVFGFLFKIQTQFTLCKLVQIKQTKVALIVH